MSYSSGKNLGHYSMLELFRMEVENQVDRLNQALLDIESGDHSDKLIEDVLRSAHSIKGAARMVNVEPAIRLAHAVEECLLAFRYTGLSFNETQMDHIFAVIDLLLTLATQSEDAMQDWLQVHEAKINKYETVLCSVVSELGKKCTKTRAAVKSSTSVDATEASEPRSSEQDTFRVSISRLGYIHGLSSEALVEAHRQDRVLDHFRQLKRQHFSLVEQISRLGFQLQSQTLDDVSRTQFEHVSRLAIRLRKELSDQLDEFENMARRQSTVLENLQYEIMSTRMRPVGEYLGGLPRFVRDLSRKLNKQVELKTDGLNTLVDREVLERVDTPVKHIIQNALDHGIELPSRRTLEGKKETATLSITISQSAGMLFIVIEDDGAGVNVEKIRATLIRQERMSKQQAKQLTDSQLLDYLFETGFSTREKANNLSGRGIGLDLVRQAVQSLGGSVYIQTEAGRGTRFQLMMPQVVSIVRCVVYDVAGERYAIPAARVANIVSMSEVDIAIRDDGQYLRYEGKVIPLLHANQVFAQPFNEISSGSVNVIVIGTAERHIALVVDELYEQQELATRRLDVNLGKIQDINGAAVLHDGKLALIVDADEYLSSAFELLGSDRQLPVWTHSRTSALDGLRILVVDDSLTAREMQRKLLVHEHCEVLTARNGIEAWDILKVTRFDLLITDIDMPEMDGFELISRLRQHEQMADMPVLMVSHREKTTQDEKIRALSDVHFLSKNDFTAHLFLESVRKLAKNLIV